MPSPGKSRIPLFVGFLATLSKDRGKTISEEINQVEGTSINLAKNQSGG
jgi:hypothetical protein